MFFQNLTLEVVRGASEHPEGGGDFFKIRHTGSVFPHLIHPLMCLI